jgi:hypothetical protein
LGKAPGMARSMSMKLPPFQHLVEEHSTERDAWLAAALTGPADAEEVAQCARGAAARHRRS